MIHIVSFVAIVTAGNATQKPTSMMTSNESFSLELYTLNPNETCAILIVCDHQRLELFVRDTTFPHHSNWKTSRDGPLMRSSLGRKSNIKIYIN